LWDILPRGIFLGGAPLNVAYHLTRQGVPAVPVSAVGRDFLGDEARRRIAAWGASDRFIARLKGRGTGTVRAELDAGGGATYRIARRVAWDRIPVPPALRREPEPAALVYGTLALRGTANRRALAELIAAWPGAWRVLDLNLRPPFTGAAAVAFALKQAQLLKLNDAELAAMTGAPRLSVGRLESAARNLGAAHGLDRICVTAGSRGAGLLWDGTWHWAAARPVEVRDTIGAGDSFLAALLAALLGRRAAPDIALATACRVGEFVASCDGATPPYATDVRGHPRPPAR
jgi:fructokinase